MIAKARIAALLEDGRRRSLDLLEPVAEADLVRQHSPIMSPLVWDLAHVGNYEDLWLVRALGESGVGPASLDDLYDAFRHPRKDRPSLPILGPDEARTYVASVRSRVLDLLDRSPLEGSPLLDDGFVYGMVVQHEHQHDETMLATLQLMAPDAAGGWPAAPPPPPAPPWSGPSEVLVPGGPFTMGTSTDPWAYDNERPAHAVDVPAFFVDTVPVTNARYAEFVDDGGYDEPRWWSTVGWKWRQSEGLVAPQFWFRDGDGWARRRFGLDEPVPPDEPVQHVCFHEADAWCRWAGRRLPTEAEWEKAAVGAGPGNVGQRWLQPAPVGSFPDGASASGALGMLGDVWEWTSSDFLAYPGFASFPYREYSEVFWGGDYKVLRGGSWATDPSCCRPTFRNWDHPIRRQIFAGFRSARDAD